jgi:hypothetical protein
LPSRPLSRTPLNAGRNIDLVFLKQMHDFDEAAQLLWRFFVSAGADPGERGDCGIEFSLCVTQMLHQFCHSVVRAVIQI